MVKVITKIDGDRTYHTLKVYAGDEVVVRFNFMNPRPGEHDVYGKYWRWSVKCNVDEEEYEWATLFISSQVFSESIEQLLEQTVKDPNMLGSYEWLISKPRETNEVTGRTFCRWKIEPYAPEIETTDGQQVKISDIDDVVAEVVTPKIDEDGLSQIQLTEVEFICLNIEKLYSNSYGKIAIKDHLFRNMVDNGIDKDHAIKRSVELADFFVKDDGTVDKALVLKHGGK